MDLGIFNNIFKATKDDNIDFKEELEIGLNDNLKQEGTYYQVIEITDDGVYLQNTETNIVDKEKLSEDLINNIDIDSVLKYENDQYIYDERKTQEFLDSFIGIGEFRNIKEKFASESGILDLDINTVFKLKEINDNICILSFNNDKNMEVPKELIPFWISLNDNLIYKNGKFERKI